MVFNISKETTRKEICKIQGPNDYITRMSGINLSGGHTNAVEFCNTLYNFPKMDELLEHMNKEITI